MLVEQLLRLCMSDSTADDARAALTTLQLEHARQRADYHALAVAYNALLDRAQSYSDPGMSLPGVIDIAMFPYPREWELEDQRLLARITRLSAALEDAARLIEHLGGSANYHRKVLGDACDKK